MPYYNGNYLAPVWVNDQPPAINQSEMLAMSQTIEASQILTGNEPPTEFTSGVVGQRYVDTSTEPYTIYKLVEAAEDANVWAEDNANGNIASPYIPEWEYDEGEYCIHGGYLYVCIESIVTPEEWNDSHWERVWLADEVQYHVQNEDNPHNVTAEQTGAYVLPSGGIPASDLAAGVIPTVPSPSDSTPQALGTAAAGSSSDYSRADHVHQKPTYSASDVGLGNVENVLQFSASNKPSAGDVTYDGTTSGLSATTAQEAIDEVAGTTDSIASDLATIEASSTASESHAAGSYLVLDGILYRATSAIASGETITPGSNVVATTVAAITGGLADALGPVQFGIYSITASTTMRLTFDAEAKGGIILMSGEQSTERGIYAYSSSSVDSVSISDILVPTQSGMSVTADSSNNVVIVNGVNALTVLVMSYRGALPILTSPNLT